MRKKPTRKRPATSFTLSPDHKLLIDTLAIQSDKTRSSILESLLNYVAFRFKDHPDEVMEALKD